ncbi:MAG: serine hydrolase domain-containing protein [Verrucomicrobiota bacterium]
MKFSTLGQAVLLAAWASGLARADPPSPETGPPAVFYSCQAAGEARPRLFREGSLALGSKEPVPLESPLRIGSVSKLFVGTIVLRLVDQDCFSLEDPIQKWVSGVPGGAEITLRQLGTHRSGLPDAIWDAEFQKAIVEEPGRFWRAEDILESVFRQERVAQPDERFVYSNANTILLALAAEKASGRSLERLLAEEIGQPLQLEATLSHDRGLRPNRALRAYRHAKPDHPIGYGRVLTEVTALSASWAHAAGNFVSTLPDLAKAAPALCSGALLSEASRKELHHWRETGQEGWRYGFCIENWDGLVGHRGDVPGYQAVMAQEQEGPKRTWVVVTTLSNYADGSGPANLFLESLREGSSPAKAK